jgi:hypothetical protein
MGKTDYLLPSLMHTGRLSVLKASPEAYINCMATVLATANYLKKIPAEVLDRSQQKRGTQYDEKIFLPLMLDENQLWALMYAPLVSMS